MDQTQTYRRSEPASRRAAIVMWLVGAVVLVIHSRSYPVLTYDDAFISLRYTQRLLEGHGLTWSEGVPVEGYSNLLWVLGCALLTILGVDLIDTPVVLGTLSAVAAIGAVAFAFAPRTWREGLPAFAGVMFLALSGPMGLWAVTGLEGCLVAALLAWAVVLLRPLASGDVVDSRRSWAAGTLLALLCLTRPDGPLFAAVACVFLALSGRSRQSLAQAVRIGTFPALAVFGQVAFRWTYYGDWVPNTARAKLTISATRVATGAQCVVEAGVSSYALWVPALVAAFVAWRDPSRRPRVALIGSLLVAWTAYAASVGCEPYGFRMLIPSLVLLTFLLAEGLDWVQRSGVTARRWAWLGTLALLAWFGVAQHSEPNIVFARENLPPATEKAATIGRTLRAAFADRDPLLAVDAAGAIPYHSGFRSLDMLGLNDAHIGRQRDDSFGEGLQGHELGDGAYVLSQEPDLIITGTLGLGGLRYRGGREMRDDPRFTSEYQRVRIEGNDPALRFHVFTRIEGAAGIRRTKDATTIPGILFASDKNTVATLNDSRHCETNFEGFASATVRGIELPAGTWRFSITGQGPFHLSVQRQSDGRSFRDREGAVELTVDAQERVDVTVRADAPAVLASVNAEQIRDVPESPTSPP